MIEEIKYFKKNYPLKTVHFSDDTFSLDREWLIEFSTIYKKEIGIPFTCNLRANLVDENIIKKLKEANCFGVTFGLECGDEDYRNKILKKNLKNKDIIRCSKFLKKYKIKFNTLNMMALPGETAKMVFETISLNNKIKADFARVGFAVPYPGLELTNYAIKKGYLSKSSKNINYKGCHEKPIFKSRDNKLLSNLLCFFPMAVQYPSLVPLIKILIKLPLNNIYKLLIPFMAFTEKRFFRISWYHGMKYFLHANFFK